MYLSLSLYVYVYTYASIYMVRSGFSPELWSNWSVGEELFKFILLMLSEVWIWNDLDTSMPETNIKFTPEKTDLEPRGPMGFGKHSTFEL